MPGAGSKERALRLSGFLIISVPLGCFSEIGILYKRGTVIGVYDIVLKSLLLLTNVFSVFFFL